MRTSREPRQPRMGAVGHRRIAAASALVALLALGACGGGGSSPEPAAAPLDGRQRPLASSPESIPADAHVKGTWSAVHDWPIIPIHSVLMPDGRVMTFGSRPDGSSTAYFGLDIWDNAGDPASGHLSIANGTGNDIFCSAHLLLPPPDMASAPAVFMAGGDAWNGISSTFIGIKGQTVYDGAVGGLVKGTEMTRPRWYASTTTLVNGEVYIQGGAGGADRPEVRQADGTIRTLTTADTSFLAWSYPRNYVMPDGRLFGYDYEGRMYFVDTAGTGTVSARTILPMQYFGIGSSAMFRPGRILQIGGNTNAAAIIDVTSGNPVFTPTQSTSTVRKTMTATLLADGQVLVTGGSPVWNELPGANKAAEIWNPVDGQWTLGAEGARARLYHSTALLLPDASVLVGGGGAPAPVGGPSIGERNVQIYYPPYLFKAGGVRATRPVITATPDWLEIGRTFNVQVTGGSSVSRVVLVKTGSATHGWNFDQRFIELSFTRTATPSGGHSLAVNSPARPGEATPGYYMLFVFDEAGVPSEARILRMGVAGPRNSLQAPSITNPGARTGTPGVATSVQLSATDPNRDRLTFSASGLPPGLSINPTTGLVSGTPATPGSYDVVVSASDGSYSDSAGFVWTITPQTPLTLTLAPTPGASLAGSSAAFAAGATGAGTVEYSWNFGDGSGDTPWSAQGQVYKAYPRPGIYSVTVRIRDGSGAVISRSFVQTVYLGNGGLKAPAVSGNMVIATPVVHGVDRLWVVNPDNDSVTAFDTLTQQRLGEVAVGAAPRTITVAANGLLWVTNKSDSTISVIDPANLVVVRTIPLARGAQPFGIAASPVDAQAFVALEGSGEVLRFDTSSFAQTGRLAVGPNVRHVTVTGDGRQVYVTRFITPPMPGESTATVLTPPDRGGEVLQIDAAAMTLTRTIVLAASARPDSESQGRGIPNYLGAMSISPDYSQGYVPGKLDNILRGTLRDGSPLNFQNTVRAISSRIPLVGGSASAEDLPRRIDHDNASLASAAAYDNRGVLMFVALETSREVAVIDAHTGGQLMRFDVGRAPQGLVVSPDGFTLFVHNFMDRTVSVHDLRPLLTQGLAVVPTVATWQSVLRERLPAQVLRGKQLFYDARDPRLARDGYMSCAACHHDGGHDGRVWDLSGFGEGLRNTISLRGRAGAHGRLHWSGNFDEVQDFEGQIRTLAGGSGLMADAAFNSGTRSQPLGDAKAGASADLDALAAYVASLDRFAASPWRAGGGLTPEAAAGRTVFAAKCAGCHGGSDFSNSRDRVLPDIGTLTTASGQRLGRPLAGLDTPTLREAWATAPYLHDGSAPTLEAAILAHRGPALSPQELANLASYVRQIDADEAAAPASQANLVVRALATLADKVGAAYEVRVNRAVVGAGQLDSAGWVDLFFDVATLLKDAVVEIVFKNDATVGSEDRNLAVQSLTVDRASTLPANAPGVVIDTGSGAQAFDNQDVVDATRTGGWMPWNGAMRFLPGGNAGTVTVRARATLAAGVGVQVELRVNGALVATRVISSTTVQDAVFATPPIASGDRIDVVFTNDALLNGEDRNLYVESIAARGAVLATTAAGVVIDRGEGAQAFDGVDVLPAAGYGGWLPWNGALRFVVP